jgi:hypothetical protein
MRIHIRYPSKTELLRCQQLFALQKRAAREGDNELQWGCGAASALILKG